MQFRSSENLLTWQRPTFLLNNGPLLITITVFVVGYFISGQIYPAMQKPQVFFNLFINNASLLIISIGMTFVVLLNGIDLSVASILALTSVASAVLLNNGMSPYRCDSADAVDGHHLWVCHGQYQSLV